MAFIALSDAAATRAKGKESEQTQIKANVSKHIADHMVKYKHLAGGVEIVDEIPKNPRCVLSYRVRSSPLIPVIAANCYVALYGKKRRRSMLLGPSSAYRLSSEVSHDTEVRGICE